MNENVQQSPKVTWETLQAQVEVFSQQLDTALAELGISEKAKTLEIDHICVRLKNNSDVADLKEQLTRMGQIISSANVNGREISIIQLDKAIQLGSWRVYGVELPYPKPNHDYSDGWEHVEFVLPGAENTIDGVRHAFMDTFAELDLDHLQNTYAYSEDDPQADDKQLPNPTVGLKVNGIGLKFHANPIQVVVGFQN